MNCTLCFWVSLVLALSVNFLGEVPVLKWKSNVHFRKKTGLLFQSTFAYLLSLNK